MLNTYNVNHYFQDGLVSVGFAECYKEEDFCAQLGSHSGVMFFDTGKISSGQGTKIQSLDAQEISREVLGFLPEMKLLDDETFKVRNFKVDLSSISTLLSNHMEEKTIMNIIEILYALYDYDALIFGWRVTQEPMFCHEVRVLGETEH